MKRFFSALAAIMVLVSIFCVPASSLAASELTYYLTNGNDSTVNAGLDTGYSGNAAIKNGDTHFGWSLGRFTMKSYTDVVMEDDVPIFLVNAGDSIILGYQLSQNIEMLNEKENVRISNDTNGYDNAMGVEKSGNGFGRGTLIVKYTNPYNKATVTTYRDYLASVQNGTANVTISSLEEGDYEIALDYEIASPAFPGSKYENYRVSCSFKVRNSNCMVFLRENTASKSELANCSVAQDGFFLDYANSHYLTVDVTREILTDNGYGLSRTTRECKRARDGISYTESGIYTVTVKNRYTNETVVMTVSVGSDQITNAYVTSNCAYDPNEISEMVTSGKASITEDWRIEMTEQPEPEDDADMVIIAAPSQLGSPTTTSTSNNTSLYIIITCIVVAMVSFIGLFISIRKNSKKSHSEGTDSESK